MGLPEILIEFKTKAVTAITRSQKGIVALILKDDTITDFDTKIYKSIDEVVSTDWTVDNFDYISKTFMGTPSKVIVEKIDSTATDYSVALSRLKNKKWNYLAIPGIQTAEVTNVASWITGMRTNEKKTFKAVLPDSPSDSEGIINFTTKDIKVGDKTYTTAEYCARLAGIFAGLPFTRSATYYALTEVESITEHEDPNADIDAGQLILINDDEKIKIGRAVNSFTTFTVTKAKPYSKIKIVDGMDLMMDDIRSTFNNSYVGKVINNYDNKILFFASINAYFKQLANDDVLDVNYDNKAEIDIEEQRLYLQSIGVDVDSLKEQEIKEYNTDSKVFAGGNVKFVDAMEDLYFTVNM